MTSAGNPNPATAFDMHRLFQSPNPNPNAPLAPSYPPSSYPIPSPSYPTPTGGPFYPPRTTPFHQNYLPYPPQEPLSNVRPSYPTPPSPNPNPSADPNHGARLMALLGTTPSSNPELPTSSSSGLLPEVFSQPNCQPGPTPVAASASLIQQATPLRLPSSKLPKGRLLLGNRVVYDVDARLHGELQPQLEVTPITKYVSDPALVVGRQIAVNRAYICYGLKLGAIRVLNINTALRSLLRGHTQRVTDMAFFAEDVHLLASASIDGRVFVWKINEGPDDEDKPQITGQIVIAIQIVGDEEVFHPRVCWHSHKQEVLVVGIGKHVLKIDTTKVGKGEGFLAEEPMKCPIDKLIEGIQLVGKHEGEVTALSMCQWMTTRLVSASVDGTVKIWEDRKPLPLVTLRPHDGQPVNSATFLKSPQRPDHIVLITAGHLNREVKMWTSTSQEGWLLPSDTELWHCTQILELKSSAKSRLEEAFFNQVVILPRVGLILLANAKKNAIYAIHVDYGPHPSATHMDYLAEFTVTMPILSLTGTSDSTSDGEQSVQVYCVQTQAIQQYALDLSQCLPTPFDPELEACMNRFLDGPAQEIFGPLDPTYGNNNSDEISLASKPPKSVFSDGPELPSVEVAVPGAESKESPATDIDNVQIGPSPLPLSPMVSGRLSGLGTPSNGFEQGQPVRDCGAVQPIHDRRVDAIHTNLSDAPTLDNNYVKDDTTLGKTDISVVPTTTAFRHPTHLITPSEILSMAVSSSEINDVNRNVESVELDVKVVGEIECSQREEFGSPFEQTDKAIYTKVQGPSSETLRERASPAGVVSVQESRHAEDVNVTSEAFELSSSTIEEEFQEATKGSNKNLLKSTQSLEILESPSAVKGKKQKVKSAQVSGPSSTSQSPFNSTDSTESVPGTSFPTLDLAPPQLLAMQETLNQLVTMQKEMQKQMSTLVAVPVNKEGRRVETALGRSMEKAVKGNADALWARFQEENAKHEKMECDRLQQIMGLISNCINKDLPSLLERTLKKELSAVGPTVSRSISQVVEKSISSAISESFQRGVGDKAVGQLEKSVYSKLEATVARQIQAQFQTTGKQTLQDVLRSSLESLVVPAFKMSCKAMFEQVDAAFQKGMIEHTTAAQQQFDSTHSPLAIALRDAINSASSVTQTLTGELADGQRKLLSLATAGANHKAISSLVTQQSNGPLAGLHEMVEAPVDPTKELQRLISERKYGEAFTAALQRSDVFIVSWLCSQVDLQGILTSIPLPLSQGVLLALLQQLACDIGNETARKLEWMGDIAIAINPVDPTIALHARPIFEQVYQLLGHQRSLPTTSPTDSNSIRLVMHVINSVLISCK